MSMDVSETLKALADTNRLRILNLLHEETLCVCDLEAILELNQSNLSRQTGGRSWISSAGTT